jgi:hypothetical protein
MVFQVDTNTLKEHGASFFRINPADGDAHVPPKF